MKVLLFTALLFLTASLITARPLSNLSKTSIFPRGAYSVAPPGSLIVSKTPKVGEYNTIQAAIDAVKIKGPGDHSIYIDAGKYNEAVFVVDVKGSLAIYGATSNTGSYIYNQVTITQGKSATLRVHIDDFKMYYVNVVNSFGRGDQAVALSSIGNRQGYYGCLISGFQDTILSSDGTQYFSKCGIKGATDIIFGEQGHAFFRHCDVIIPTVTDGWILAPKGTSASSHAFFVLDSSSIIAERGARPSTMYLGRPWGSFAQAAVQSTYLGDFINPLGWDVWHITDPRTQNVKFSEYHNTGPGNRVTQRAAFSSQLPQPISIESVLGSTHWIDQSFTS